MYLKPRLAVLMTLWLLESQTTGSALSSMSSARIARRVADLNGINHDIDYQEATCEVMRRKSPYHLETLIKTKVTDRQVRRDWIPILHAKPVGVPMRTYLMEEFVELCAHYKKDARA